MDTSNIILIGVLAFGGAVIGYSFIPETTESEVRQFLPWDIQSTAAGSSMVFGMTLDATTLTQAQQMLGSGAEISLFQETADDYRIEAYFDKVLLGGLPAQLVLVLDLPQQQQAAMFTRGLRISNLGAGRKRVSLAAVDVQSANVATITSITYLTRMHFDSELVQRRFGEPAQRWPEPDTGTNHWLYPVQGLDVALMADGSAVLQYISPLRFSELTQALHAVPGNRALSSVP